MLNKHTTRPPSDILLARLRSLFEDVNELYQTGTMVLESDLISSYHEALNLFYKTLDNSVVGTTTNVYAGAPADPIEFDEFTSAIQKDLKAVFSEIGALDRLVSSSFNSIVSERNQALETSKRVSNKLGDYLLYSDPKLGAGYFFGDSFNTSNRVDIGSTLVGTDECYLSTDEGIVLLPLDGTPERPEIKSFIINKQSNGVRGNNQQLNIYGHDAPETMGDDNPDTWFEYEKVTSLESNIPLVLDLTIALKEISIINHINIKPINFGSPTPVKIKTIETSKDGVEYVSIKDEIPISDFLSEEEDDVFQLSGSTSKSAGEGFYSFLPRRTQYVHIVFEQHTPYSIETNNGLRLRYAIGIRDINVLSRRFKPEGTLVSTEFTIDQNAKKISLWASENPVDVSTLADVTHFLSYDDGATWLPIQPQQRSGNLVPEIVNFNNISSDSISTENAVDTFRHKIYMKREKDSFTGDITLKQERLQKLDVLSSPSGGSFTVNLTETPIKETVRVLMPYMGSFSCPRPRQGDIAELSPTMDLDFVKFNVDVDASQTITTEVPDGEGGTTTETSNKGTVRYKLPFRNIPNLSDKIRVFFNGAQIEYLPKDENVFSSPPTSHSSIDEYSKVYYLNRDGLELQFGHIDSTDTQRGFIPKAGSRVEICLDGDNPPLALTDRGYVINLMAPSDGDKENISIVALESLSEDEAETYEIEVPSGASKFLPPDIMTDNVSVDAVSEFARPGNESYFDSQLTGSSKSSSSRPTSLSNTENNTTKKIRSSNDIKYTTLKERLQFIKDLKARINEDPQERAFSYSPTGTEFSTGREGSLPPVFIEGVDNFYIKEFSRKTGNVITGPSRQFTDKVAFIDGDSELRVAGVKQPDRYTFNYQTGAVYLGSEPNSDRRVVLYCKKINTKSIPQEFWKFDRNIVSNKINTQKIVLDPSVVFTVRQITQYSLTSNDDNSIKLLSGNTNAHSWFNKRIVIGTVKPDSALFQEGVKPNEVPFIDGSTELSSIVKVRNESITLSAGSNPNEYEATLSQLTSSYPNRSLVGSPSLSAVRTDVSGSSPTNAFDIDGQKPSTTVLTTDGEWKVSESGGDIIITLYLTSTPGSHTVSYRYNDSDSGVDTDGLYSVDYNNGAIYFSNPIAASGNVEYEVSLYSAFYNIATPVKDMNIEEINTDDRSVKFSSAFGMKFLKQDLAESNRPQYMKVLYDYYKKSTESLADIEPYFSPICKDIAFRAVTADLLQEL